MTTAPRFDRDALRALTARLGLPGVVDAHCHFMPQEVFDKVWGWFDREAPRDWPIAYRLGEDARRRVLEDLGIVRYTTLNYAHRPGMAEWLNGWTLELLDRDPRAIGTATFFPEENAGRYVERVLADPRIRGFKLHLQVGGFHPDDPLLHPCYARVQEAGRVLVIHSGTGPVSGRHTRLDALTAVLDRFPRLTVVVAHMGAFEYEAYLDLAEQRENVHLDTTMVFTDYDLGRFFPEALVPRLPALQDKILFGSDFPNIPYRYEHAVEGLVRLHLGDAWLRAVLHDNAVRLFGI